MKPTITTETAYGDTLSISELFSAHPGERLYIHPLLWTRRHLDLLGCEFLDDGILSPPPPSPSISPPPPGVGDNGEVTWVERYHLELYSDTNKARCLATGKRVYDKCWSLSRLLGFEYCRDQVRFRFACRVVADLPCQYLASSSPSPSLYQRPAQLGYLHLPELARYRRIRLSRHLGTAGSSNPQDLYHIQDQLRHSPPIDPYEDPYLVALLITLAQKQAREQQLGKQNDINDTDNKDKRIISTACISSQMLLVTNPDDTTWLHIYTSNISTEFLDRLDRPSRPPPADMVSRIGMVVSHQRLAFEPYHTLSQRLGVVVMQTVTNKRHHISPTK